MKKGDCTLHARDDTADITVRKQLSGLLRMGVPLSAEALPHDPAGWSALIATAHDAQVSPMLYSRLHQAGLLDRVPSMQQSLQLPVWRLTARNEQRTRELTSIARALHDAGIPLIPLKGACLDLWVYPRPGLRPMSDLDVLIPGADTARAAAVMLDMGYRCDKPLVEDVTVLQEVHHLPAFTHPTRHTHVEVHGTLASAQRSFVQSETIWKHAQPAEINGVPVLRLCPEHLLMHVCWHGVLLHRLQDTGLRIVLDVAMILQRFEHSLDWDLLLDQTRGAPWERAVALGIWAAQALLNAPVPVHAMQQLGLNDLPEPVTDAVRQSLFTTPFGGASPNGATCLAAVFTQPWRKRWEYLNRSLWRSPEFLATVYGVHPRSRWFWLCYPRRVIDAMRDYGPRLLCVLRGDRQEVLAAMPSLTIEMWCREARKPRHKG